jgi:hypothetical protein
MKAARINGRTTAEPVPHPAGPEHPRIEAVIFHDR